ncbi:GGDEF domain-containing protein [Vibrio sp. HN007]|uniref:GGDEF domain-containing protein n=1 Tax=Vibrio iocasae TaxID=3098914 RepID=UPI0035D44974
MLGIFQRREKLFILIVAEIVLFISMVFVAIAFLRMQAISQESYKSATELRYESYLLADQLRQSSDDLTRMVRSYAVSGNNQFEQYFWDILAIRNGEKARPDSYERVYWDFMTVPAPEPPFQHGDKVPLEELMRKAGFTQSEFRLLSKAQAHSDELVLLEEIAMNAMVGKFQDSDGKFTVQQRPNPILAQSLLFGEQYHVAKKNIMSPINGFLEAIDKRTAKSVLQAESQVIFYHRALSKVFGSLIIIGLALVFTFLRYQKLLLGNLTKAVREQKVELKERVKAERQLEEKNAQLKYLSRIDGLTGVFNRGHFNNLLEKEHARHRRNKDALSLLLLDVDFFKQYNDCYGHVKGDDCLIKVANILSRNLHRPADFVARYGGEEFVCVLPETDLQGASNVANNILRTIRASNLTHEGSEVGYVTVSIGVASSIVEKELSKDELLAQADELLYLAKSLGRNRVAYY